MPIYIKINNNFQSCTTLKAKLAMCETIIMSMYDAAAQAALNGDIVEYTLDDGQSKISTVKATGTQLAATIQAFEQLAESLRQQIYGGGITRLMDEKNFRGPRC